VDRKTKHLQGICFVSATINVFCAVHIAIKGLNTNNLVSSKPPTEYLEGFSQTANNNFSKNLVSSKSECIHKRTNKNCKEKEPMQRGYS